MLLAMLLDMLFGLRMFQRFKKVQEGTMRLKKVQAGSRRFNEGSRIKGARMLFGSRMFQRFKKVK